MYKPIKAIAGLGLGLAALVAGCSDSSAPSNPTPSQGAIAPHYRSQYVCGVDTKNRGQPTYKTPESKAPQFTIAAPPKGREQIANRLENGVLDVYYPTRSWQLFPNDRADIANFMSQLPKGALVVEGYADHRGTPELNQSLTDNRGEGVAKILELNGFRVTRTSYGNTKSQITADPEMLAKDRRVSIISGQTAIARGLDQLMADVYLVDKTGSMAGSRWQAVLNYVFPEQAKVYTFSTINACTGQLATERPDGNTPLFASLYETLQITERGKKVTVLTDGDDNIGVKTPEQIISLAKDKGVSVSFVSIGVPQGFASLLTNISKGTNGAVYDIPAR